MTADHLLPCVSSHSGHGASPAASAPFLQLVAFVPSLSACLHCTSVTGGKIRLVEINNIQVLAKPKLGCGNYYETYKGRKQIEVQ